MIFIVENSSYRNSVLDSFINFCMCVCVFVQSTSHFFLLVWVYTDYLNDYYYQMVGLLYTDRKRERKYMKNEIDRN